MRKLGFIALCAAFLASSYNLSAQTPFPKVSEPIAITQGPKDHLFASYYGINSWSPDNRYVAILETDIKDRLSEDGEYATLALVDLKDNNKIIPIAKTCTWNFQEAAMCHWLPWAKNTLLYNDKRDGKFVTVILNWKTGKERIIPYPVSAVSKDGEWAVSINYARLRISRPDYGYAGNGQDAQRDVAWPDNDGLWLVNLKSGEAKLILTVASLKDQMTQMEDPKGMAYFCHTVFNPSATKIFFLARTVENLDAQTKKVSKWKTTSFTCDVDGSNVRRCFPDGWGGSHFNWKDDETLAVTAKWEDRVYGHTIFTVGEEEKVQHIGAGILDFDGHCLFSPDGKFMSSDGYYKKKVFERPWVLVRLEDQAIISLGAFYVPEVYRNTYSRCDLHPRFRPDGKQIGFNSVHEGSRQVYIRNIDWK